MDFSFASTLVRIEPGFATQSLLLIVVAVIAAMLFRRCSFLEKVLVGILVGGLWTLSLFVHEFCHLGIASILNVQILMIRFTAVGASTIPGHYNEISTTENFLIALAGPLSNILLGIVFLACAKRTEKIFLKRMNGLFGMISTFYGLYNFLPIWGDGKRVVSTISLLTGGYASFPVGVLWMALIVISAFSLLKWYRKT